MIKYSQKRREQTQSRAIIVIIVFGKFTLITVLFYKAAFFYWYSTEDPTHLYGNNMQIV